MKPADPEVCMQSDEQAIRELVAQWHRATAAGDVDTVLGLMPADAAFMLCGKPPMKGREPFEKGLRTVLKSHRIESRGDIQELLVSGDLAYALTQLTVRVVPLAGGDVNERTGTTLTLFRKQPDGRWLLWRDANLLPPL